MDIPMVICGEKIVNDCEKCGYVYTLAEKGQSVQLGEYKCQNCGHPFSVFVAPDGKIGILDSAANGLPPIDNTK